MNRERLRRSGLLDGVEEPDFERLLNHVASELRAPVALVSILDKAGDRQFFKGAIGLGEPWRALRQTPLSHSFCRHVVEERAPLVIGNARNDPRVRENPAITELDVAAYLGAPITLADGEPIGALCAIDSEPREWTAGEQRMLEILADAASAIARARLAALEAEESRLAAEALADSLDESARVFRDLASNVPGAIFRYIRHPDGHDEIVYMSDGCLDIWELPALELKGDPSKLWSMIVPEDLEQMRLSVERSAKLLCHWTHRWRIKPESGVTKWVQGYGRPRAMPGGGVLWNSLILDVSVEAKAQQQLQASQRILSESQKRESVGRIAGGVAHDFNNLLAIILGNAELLQLQQEISQEEPDHLVGEIIAAAEMGASLTRRLLSFVRKADLHPEACNLNAQIRDMEGLIRSAVPESISLRTVLARDLWDCSIDRSMFESTVFNLIINARDAIKERGHITLETQKQVVSENYLAGRFEDIPPGNYVMFSVTDDGEGIESALQDKIFEPFVTTKTRDKGTGLGLAVVQGFVKQSGGTVRVYSEPGHGTSFKILLPAAGTLADATEAVPRLDGKDRERPARILLVEDDEAVRRVAQACLKSGGHQVLVADSGDAGLALFLKEGEDIDLIISDVVMPGSLQGPEMVARIREQTPLIPVVYTSGYPHEANVHGNGIRPSDMTLTKPVSRDLLLAAVQSALNP
ncbi:ATP-binding protein [Chromatocurvus halotolerans]|uniref:histidine kinase n=1 Tax=Chromatocurvus halotolerans TaxID=1132028 RepID=A0A4R2L9X8_9GAMM|nr:ATP-binding protein [Chromatocurvus halotolerans]TCO76055.1 phospho-acceptor domain-containing protein [Chromatocurvus halotolerans]